MSRSTDSAAVVCAIVMAVALMLSCTRRSGGGAALPACDTVAMDHAQLLHIYRLDSCTLAVVDNPWQPGATLHRYVMVGREAPLPSRLPEGTLLRTPLRRMVVAASPHLALMRDMGALRQVCATCDVPYLVSPDLRQAVADGSILDAGSSMMMDIERVMAAEADAILLSPYERSGYGALEKTGVPIVECADYMETSALGRAEWMRFYALLTGHEAEGDSMLADTRCEYGRLKQMGDSAENRPTVFCDLPLASIWYVPGGRSTVGRLLADAGGRYLWADDDHSGSLPLAPETVAHKAASADIWVIKYGASADYTYASLASDNNLCRTLKAYGERRVWGCNVLRKAFAEETAFRPHLVLRDLMMIMHPELFGDSRPQYYKPLEQSANS